MLRFWAWKLDFCGKVRWMLRNGEFLVLFRIFHKTPWHLNLLPPGFECAGEAAEWKEKSRPVMDPLSIALICRTAFRCFGKLFTLDRRNDEPTMQIEHCADESAANTANNGSESDFLLFRTDCSSQIFAYRITSRRSRPYPHFFRLSTTYVNARAGIYWRPKSFFSL